MNKLLVTAIIIIFAAAGMSAGPGPEKRGKKLKSIQQIKRPKRTAPPLIKLWNSKSKTVVVLRKRRISYCELAMNWTAGSNRYATVVYDAGHGNIIDPKSTRKTNPKIKSFANSVEAINWMERDGWVCFGSYVFKTKFRYMLRRRPTRELAELVR